MKKKCRRLNKRSTEVNPIFKAMQDMNLNWGRYEELSCQIWYVRESYSEPFFRNKDIIIQGNPCIKILEAMKVNYWY